MLEHLEIYGNVGTNYCITKNSIRFKVKFLNIFVMRKLYISQMLIVIAPFLH